MRISHLTAAVLAAITATGRAVAQQAADTTSDTTRLRPVVISATRVPVERSSAPATVTVLGGEALRSRGIVSVADALASVPGLSVVQSGSFGATTSLFARGGESDYVKVLIDGVPVNNPGGTFDFASLTTDNIDRIEIVRGPTSVVYGSDAVAGVVQLFTRKGEGPARGFADFRSGSFGTFEASLGVDGSSSAATYSLAAATRETDGIYAFNNDYRNRGGTARVSFAPSIATIDLTGRRTDATYHFPTDGSGQVVDSNGVRRDRRTTVGIDLSRRLTPSLEVRLLGAASRLDGGSSNQPDSPGDSTGFYGEDDTRTERRSVDLRADYQPTTHSTLSFGGAVEREEMRQMSESQFGSFPASSSSFEEHRTNAAAYAQYITEIGKRFTLTTSARVDDNETYGAFVTGRAAVAWALGTSTTMRASVGNAFKSPGFDEAFSTAFTIGNQGLEPERTTSWEAALEHRIGPVTASATYFDQRFRDLIQYVDGDASTEFRGTYENLGAALARGVELEVSASRFGAFDAAASMTALTTRVTDAGTGAFGTFVNGERLLRRPATSATLDFGFRPALASRIGASVRFVGERDDRDFANDARVTLASYTLLDLSAELALNALSPRLAPLTLTAKVENAFDRDYEPALGFKAPGRTILVGARARLGGKN